MIPAGSAQVNMKFIGTAVPTGAEITFGVTPPTALTLLQVADAVVAAWNSSLMKDMHTSTMTLSAVGVKFGPNATGASGDFPYNIPGTNTGAAAPPNVSMLYRKGTSFGGRAGRGRFYLPAVPEVNVDQSGVVSATFHSQAVTKSANFLAALASGGVPMVVLHGLGSPLSTPSSVLTLTVDTVVATQRRRLRR